MYTLRIITCIYVHITNLHTCMICEYLKLGDVDLCTCARLGCGGAPQWIFQFHVVFSFAHRRFHPSASSFPTRSKPRSASLTLEVCAACLCTAVIYSLFERGTARASPLHCWGGGSESGRRRRRNLSISNSPSVVNSSIYRRRAAATDVSRNVLEASRNATGRGRWESRAN